MSEKFVLWTQPPVPNGGAALPAYGERAVAILNTGVTSINLTGDVFQQAPDGAGNASTNDFLGDVEIELDADGDDIMVLCGPAALTPSFAANSGSNPNNVGRVIYNSKATGQVPRRIWFRAGNKAGECNVLSAISRTGAATLRYRVVSAVPAR